MSEIKKPKQKTVTIGGIEFVFQFPGVRKALQMADASKDRYGNLLSEPYYSQIMEHVIVSPRTNWEFWDEHLDIMEDVFEEAFRFLHNPR